MIIETIKKTKYPTKNKIINCKVTPTKTDIKITKIWKKTIWKMPKNTEEKIKTIKILLQLLLRSHNMNTKIISKSRVPSPCYSKKYDTIILNNSSIISALHEMGHAIYGRSELKACSWSTKLFQESFQTAFRKLVWKGHMLIQKIDKKKKLQYHNYDKNTKTYTRNNSI